MSSFIVDEFGDYGFRVKRMADITFQTLDEDVANNAKEDLQNGSEFLYNGQPCFVLSVGGQKSVDGLTEYKITLRPTRAPVLPIMKEGPVKIRNKYYVAADKVTTPAEQNQDNKSGDLGYAFDKRWTKKDLKDAIAHAEEILELNPRKDHVAVVKIIRVVRRKKAPVTVEVIR